MAVNRFLVTVTFELLVDETVPLPGDYANFRASDVARDVARRPDVSYAIVSDIEVLQRA